METLLFNCSTVNDDLSREIFAKKIPWESGSDIIKIHQQQYKVNLLIEEVTLMLKVLRKQFLKIQSVVLHDANISYNEIVQAREEINVGLSLILEIMIKVKADGEWTKCERILKMVQLFSVSVLSIKDFDEKILLILSNTSSASSNLNCPIYQYFHCYLETNYFMFQIFEECNMDRNILNGQVKKVMGDLVNLSFKYFYRRMVIDISPFLCNCLKQFWNFLQYFTKKEFWIMFTECVNKCNDNLFKIWFLKFIAVECHFAEEKTNFPLLEEYLKNICAIDGHHVGESILLLQKIILKVWFDEAGINSFFILWDFLSKHLRVAYNEDHKVELTAKAILYIRDRLCERLVTTGDCFEMYIALLFQFLKRYPAQWGKIKSRFFSQISPHKAKDFTDTEVCRVMLLYMTFSELHFDELRKKIQVLFDVLLNVSDKRDNVLMSRLYIVFLMLHVRKKLKIDNLSSQMNKMLLEASENTNNFSIITHTVIELTYLINKSPDMDLGQWAFINAWLYKYMRRCSQTELEIILNSLGGILDRAVGEYLWDNYRTPYLEYVYPNLKYLANEGLSPNVGLLAAKISLNCPTVNNEAFVYFTSDGIKPEISREFLNKLLENSTTFSPNKEKIIIKTWLRICILTNDNFLPLTEKVTKLESFPQIFRIFVCSSDDPLWSFIEVIGDHLDTFTQNQTMFKFVEDCFSSLSISLTKYFKQPENEATVLRIYTCMSLAILTCGPILYNKYKPTSPFKDLVDLLLLPSDIITGKRKPHEFVLRSVQKTLHLYLEGISTLHESDDPYISRKLKELIATYLPLLPKEDSPIFLCLEKETTAAVVFENISQIYLKHPVKESDTNVIKALKIVKDYIESNSNVALIRILVNKTLCGLFDVMIYTSGQKSAIALSVVNTLMTSTLYEQIKTDVENCFVILNEKHLSFNTERYFTVLGIFARTVPKNMTFLPQIIMDNIKKVEQSTGSCSTKARSYLLHFQDLLSSK